MEAWDIDSRIAKNFSYAVKPRASHLEAWDIDSIIAKNFSYAVKPRASHKAICKLDSKTSDLKKLRIQAMINYYINY